MQFSVPFFHMFLWFILWNMENYARSFESKLYWKLVLHICLWVKFSVYLVSCQSLFTHYRSLFSFEPVWATCFGLMWPSSGSLIYMKSLHCSCYVNISQCLNVRSDTPLDTQHKHTSTPIELCQQLVLSAKMLLQFIFYLFICLKQHLDQFNK
jgi:hypothetical protein